MINKQEKREQEIKKQKTDELAKKKAKERKLKEKKDHEATKKMIQEYKQRKLATEELLANADLDDLEGELNDSYSDEGEANAVMDQMIE